MKKELEYLCQVDANHFIAAENEYCKVIKSIANHKRYEHEQESRLRNIRPLLIWSGKLLSLLGIGLGILMLLPIGICKTDYLLSSTLLTFFIAGFLFFNNEKKISNALWNTTINLISESQAEHTFKTARKLIPFEANYQFSDDEITYSRVKDSNSQINWKKKIEGQYYIGENFIITYKKKSLFPHLFMFIKSTEEVNLYLSSIGICRLNI